MAELHVLLGVARGWLDAQPLGPRPERSRAAYRRYARLGVEGFGKWDIPSDHAEKLVSAGMRVVALERLEAGAAGLEAALSSGDAAEAERAAEEVRGALGTLREHRVRRRGRKREGRTGA